MVKRDSSSWLRVWAMMMGELKRERVGSNLFAEIEMDESDKGEETNLME